jgi:hypothetical protein
LKNGFTVFLFFYAWAAHAQTARAIADNNFSGSFKEKNALLLPLGILPPLMAGVPFKPSTQFSYLPANFYSQHMGIMCKQELFLQKTINLPIFFRLGSVQYVNYLEGKK